MPEYTRSEVASIMTSSGLVPLFYHEDIQICHEVLSACYKGGARLLEFTSRGTGAIEVFRELSLIARKEMPEMILGVGSVTDAGTAGMYMQYGAQFVVTPVLREDIAMTCNRRKVLWSPGCATLTEIARAEELGCEIVKVFPGNVLGPGFVSAIKGPCPWTNVMVTGGVTPEHDNLKSWFTAGVNCVGMGSALISKEVLANKAYERIESTIRKTLEIIASVRKEKYE